MTTKLEQAARQALKALIDSDDGGGLRYTEVQAVAALREALAEQAEQEPVASRQIGTPDVCGEVCARAKLCYGCNKDLEEANAKYTKQAEQTKQEPVGYLYDYRQSGEVFSGVFTDDFEMVEFNYGYNIRPLYATPVRTKDLTDDEILEADNRSHGNTEWTKKKAFARAVIAKDREKNK